MNCLIFINKDSPDYRPSYGKTFTERQMKILAGDLPLEEVRLNEISIIMHKAEALEDEEKVMTAKDLYNQKRKKHVDSPYSMSSDEARKFLLSTSARKQIAKSKN